MSSGELAEKGIEAMYPGYDLAPLAAVAALLGASTAQAVTISIDMTQDRKRVDKSIYGVNSAHSKLPQSSSTYYSRLPYPANRWGGNRISRYHYRNRTTNAGRDWWYLGNRHADEDHETVMSGTPPSSPLLLTIPMLDYVSSVAAGQQHCSYIKRLYSCASGSGHVLPNGEVCGGKGSCGRSYDASAVNSVELQRGYVRAVKDRIDDYSLDNEPFLWGETHDDVAATPRREFIRDYRDNSQYLWERTVRFGQMIKQEDPSARIFGPVTWGWCDFVDGSGCNLERAAGVPKIEAEYWIAQYLQNVCSTSPRPVDVLDIHWYPQEYAKVSATSSCRVVLQGGCDNDSAEIQRARLRSVKELWDPAHLVAFEDGRPHREWNLQLLRRARRIRDTYCPGLQIAVTEWRTGDYDDRLTTALADAEVLALFGREGVDVAYRWIVPAAGSLAEDTFRIFLDYDNDPRTATAVEGTSVRASSDNADVVSAYAVEAPDAATLYVILFNKDTAPQTVPVALAGATLHGGSAAMYGFDQNRRMSAPATNVPVNPTGFTLELPARSARLVVAPIAPAAAPVFTLTASAVPFRLAAGQSVVATGSSRNDGSTSQSVILQTLIKDATGVTIGKSDCPTTVAPGAVAACPHTQELTLSGAYGVSVGVFSPDWTHLHAWKDGLAAITVDPPPRPGPFVLSAEAPRTGAAGALIPVIAIVDNQGAPIHDGVIDVELRAHDAARTKLAQDDCAPLLIGGVTQCTVDLALPPLPQNVDLDIGVFGKDWTPMYIWGRAVRTIAVVEPTPVLTLSGEVATMRVELGAPVVVTGVVRNGSNTSNGIMQDLLRHDDGSSLSADCGGAAAPVTLAGGGASTICTRTIAPNRLGRYTLSVGVFTPAWEQLAWQDGLASLTIVDDVGYDFEAGTGWVHDGGSIKSLSSTTDRAYVGQRSLAVSFGGAVGETRSVWAESPAAGRGAVLSLRLWIPAGSTLTSVQPFVQEGASGAWRWTGTWRSVASLVTNAWNTVTVTVPANAALPLWRLGVQYTTNSGWIGVTYVDHVTW